MAARHRPHRGPAGPEIEVGDPFGQYEKQGGAQPGDTESGNLQAREYGVPQADIPGGLNHLANRQSEAEKPAHKGERPADAHKYHGVPPHDNGLYHKPERADELGAQAKAEPEPKFDETVPVRVVQAYGERYPIRKLITEGPQTVTGPEPGSDPIRLADRDPKRSKFWICNETTATGVGQAGPLFRIGDWETVADGRGLAIPANTIKDFNTQDSVYAHVASGVTVTFSFGYETEIEGTG